MRRLTTCFGWCALVAVVVSAQAQEPAATPLVDAYKVNFRYQISTDLQQRYAFYRQMLSRLEPAGFKPDKSIPQAELYGDTLSGTIPASGLGALRLEPYVRAAVLVPSGFELPTEADRTVLVRLELTTVLGPVRQPDVANQARSQLRPLGFQENEGYEHIGHTRLLGRLPVAALNALLRETMEVTLSRSTFQGPTLQFKSPLVRLAMVIAEPSPPLPDVARPVAASREYLDRISPDLRALLAKIPEGDIEKLMRVELVLRGHSLNGQARHQLVNTEAMFILEGSLGPVVTGLVTPSRIPVLAQVPIVSTVRLPQAAEPYVLPGNNASLGVDFVQLGREQLPAVTTVSAKPRAPGRTVIIGDDFRGYERHIGLTLPKNNTRFIDITLETRPDLTPAPLPEGGGIGQSTLIADAFLKTHPADEVLLVRMDPALLYQLGEVGNAILGYGWQTDAFNARKEELRLEADRIETERLEVRLLRRRVLTEYGIDQDSAAKREEYRKRNADLEARQKEYVARVSRSQKFQDSVAQLRGAGTVLVALQWDDGYVDLPGQAPRLRYLSTDVFRATAWYQALGRRPGQVWSGLFRDHDGDAVMEFTSELRTQRPDLAFLAWKPLGVGQVDRNLPEGTVVEVSINWSEAHDTTLSQEAKDIYRKPLADLSLNVLRQRDPAGTKLPVDVFEVMARTPFLADRVENDPRYSIYQSTVRFVVPPGGGRFAIDVTGYPPASTLPAGIEPTMPERQELRPKIVVEVVDPAKRQQGRVVFEKFATPE